MIWSVWFQMDESVCFFFFRLECYYKVKCFHWAWWFHLAFSLRMSCIPYWFPDQAFPQGDIWHQVLFISDESECVKENTGKVWNKCRTSTCVCLSKWECVRGYDSCFHLGQSEGLRLFWLTLDDQAFKMCPSLWWRQILKQIWNKFNIYTR